MSFARELDMNILVYDMLRNVFPELALTMLDVSRANRDASDDASDDANQRALLKIERKVPCTGKRPPCAYLVPRLLRPTNRSPARPQ